MFWAGPTQADGRTAMAALVQRVGFLHRMYIVLWYAGKTLIADSRKRMDMVRLVYMDMGMYQIRTVSIMHARKSCGTHKVLPRRRRGRCCLCVINHRVWLSASSVSLSDPTRRSDQTPSAHHEQSAV